MRPPAQILNIPANIGWGDPIPRPALLGGIVLILLKRNVGNHRIPDVDVLCVGSGIASLAVAIVTADAGLSVRIVDCNPSDMACVGHTVSAAPSWATEFQHRWGGEALTERTRWYVDALTEGFGPPSRLELSAARHSVSSTVRRHCHVN